MIQRKASQGHSKVICLPVEICLKGFSGKQISVRQIRPGQGGDIPVNAKEAAANIDLKKKPIELKKWKKANINKVQMKDSVLLMRYICVCLC